MLNPVSSSTPLSEVFPWSKDQAHTILVADSIHTDGRFVLHTFATTHQRIWWLAGGPFTDTLISTAQSKLSKHDMQIRSLTTELAEQEDPVDPTQFLQQLYLDMKEWMTKTPTDQPVPWIILDDVSCMAGLMGKRLTYAWILSIQALAQQHSVGLLIRCSHDHEQQETESPSWIGASSSDPTTTKNRSEYWETNLVESMDWVVDVTPLASGVTREAHGKLIMTCQRQQEMKVFNYCLTDQKVLAIRVKGSV